MSPPRALAAMLVALVAMATILAPAAVAQNLPKRELVVTGGNFVTDAYIDVGALTPPVFELDDREWIGTPHMSIMCYAPAVPKEEFLMYTHMEDVVYPVIWYYPLEHGLGTWKYEYGDSLTCELWECDGAPDGCSPKRPNDLPNPKAGDDLLGRATLEMANFDTLASRLLNFTVPADGKGEVGGDAGAFLVQCKGCRETWERDSNYVNPYAQYKPDAGSDPSYPNPTVPPADGSGSLPWRPTPLPSPGSVATPPTDPTGSNPSLPWRDGDGNGDGVQPFDGLEQTDASGDAADSADSAAAAPSSGNNTLVIVLAVVGGLVGALVIAVGTYFILKKCRYRAVEPEEAFEQNEKDDAVARHLRIRVARPAEAEAAITAAKGDAAMAELPWVPQTKH